MHNTTIKILAISGSLRNGSSNHKIVNTIAGMAPENVSVHIYNGLGSLPHFDDGEYKKVNEWKKQISGSDGILICTPEYAFGVPGALKMPWTGLWEPATCMKNLWH